MIWKWNQITARADKALRDNAIRTACLERGHTMADTVRKVETRYSTISKIIKGKRRNV